MSTMHSKIVQVEEREIPITLRWLRMQFSIFADSTPLLRRSILNDQTTLKNVTALGILLPGPRAAFVCKARIIPIMEAAVWIIVPLLKVGQRSKQSKIMRRTIFFAVENLF